MKEYPQYIKIDFEDCPNWIGTRIGNDYYTESVRKLLAADNVWSYDIDIFAAYSIDDLENEESPWQSISKEEYDFAVKNRIRKYFGDRLDFLKQEVLKCVIECQKLLEQIKE